MARPDWVIVTSAERAGRNPKREPKGEADRLYRRGRGTLEDVALATALLLLATLAGCSRRAAEVPEPDLTTLESPVAAVLRRALESVRAAPDSAEAWGDLGSLYDAHLITEPAERCYRRAQALAPQDFRWIYLLAIVRELQGASDDELVELFSRAADLDPEYAPLRIRLGDALWRRGRFNEALPELERALSLAPGTAMGHRRLGQVLLALDRPEEAARHLERAISLEPRDLAAHTGLVQALMRLGQTERAREMKDRARGLEPVLSLHDPVYAKYVFMRNMSSAGAFARGVAAVREGALDHAIQDLTLVLEVRPDDSSAHFWLGTALRRAGRPDEALAHLTRAVELDPQLAQARLDLGELLLGLGRTTEAREQFDAAARLKRPAPR